MSKRDMYRNFGQTWYQRQRYDLRRDFDAGMSLQQLCEVHGRNPNALVNKLAEMGLVKESKGVISRFNSHENAWYPWARVRDDVVISETDVPTDGLNQPEQVLREVFEKHYIRFHPQSSVRRAPHNRDMYLFSFAQNLWNMTVAIHREMGGRR